LANICLFYYKDVTVNYSFQDRKAKCKTKKNELSVEEVFAENESSKIINETNPNQKEFFIEDKLIRNIAK
jgi:alpha-N-acetylglucosamine transferase